MKMDSRQTGLFRIANSTVIIAAIGIAIFAGADENKNDTLIYCAEAQPSSFNPQLATDGATFNASSRTIYNRLLSLNDSTTHVVPSLAESWKVSPNGKEITLKLREDVQFGATKYFTPTRFFNADDVLFTFRRMLDSKHPYHKIGGGKYPRFEGMQMPEIIQSIEKIDDHQIKIILRRPEAPFLANLSLDFASIFSAEYAEKLIKEKRKEDLDILPVGTGPFIFRSYEKDKVINYEAHKSYFDGPAKIPYLRFVITRDAHQRYENLKSGLCHLIPEPAPKDIPEIKSNSKVKLLSRPGMNISYLAFNMEKMPFQNIQVRKAIHHALNRQKYIQEVFGGHAQVAKSPLPPLMWSYKRDLVDFDYDPEKAKSILKTEGMSEGFRTELWYADVSRPYNPNVKLMAQLIQQDLAAVGIKAELKEFEWQEFLRRSRLGEPPLSLQGWTGDSGDPDNFLNNLLSCKAIQSGNNRARWCNKMFSFLVDRARVSTSLPTRIDFYEKAQAIFKEQIPWVTLSHATVFKVTRANIKGFRISSYGTNEFHRMEFE